MNIQVEALKLKVFVEHLSRARTIENAIKLLQELKSLGNVNLQFIQDFLLIQLLIMIDSTDKGGRNVNEFKTVLIQCINIVLSKSKILNELPYKTVLSIISKQIFDRLENKYNKELSEELKMAIFDCFEVSSRNLDSNVIESFMVKENQLTIGNCIFICKEAIVKEKYMKIRKKAVEALMSLSQCHDCADNNDVVLREQISKVLFAVLPGISTSLINVCKEDTLRGPHLIQVSMKALGRFLSLIFYDYAKKTQQKITNNSFLQLVEKSESKVNSNTTKIQQKVTEQEKTEEWLRSASKKLSMLMVNLKVLRISEYKEIRYELGIMSFNLLLNCRPNIEHFMRFLIENIVILSADSDDKIKTYNQEKLTILAELIPQMDQEISELFNLHLNSMPRILMTGLDAEKISGIALLSSFIRVFSCDSSQFEAILNNSTTLEKLLNILICCCELETPNEFISFETTVNNDLGDQYYQFKKPWKKFKHLRDDTSIKMFNDLCRNLACSKSTASCCVNFIFDNINSIEHVVCLIEILTCDEDSCVEIGVIEDIFEEFLSDVYWNLPVKHNQVLNVVRSQKSSEFYKDSTLGLYESAIEVRLYDKPYNSENDDEEFQRIMSLKTLKYNILSTCIILELTGRIALKLKNSFQKFLLRCLHRVLEKAGNSNFLIKSAGIYALECIKDAMNYVDLSQLIDENSNFLLFNIHKLLKHSNENESILDMLSIIFKYSKTSINDYIDDIVEMTTNQMTTAKKYQNSQYHLKLFELYMSSVSNEIKIDNLNLNASNEWSDFVENCINELTTQEPEEENIEINENENEDQFKEEANDELSENQEEKEKLPLHIELILRILNTSLPFFASGDQTEVILTHEIFRMALPILHIHEKEFLPIVHKMWYPFTKQFQGKNFVILQHSFQLLTVTAHYAKDFIYKNSLNNIIPTINDFLKSSFSHTNSNENFSYTQEFKLQKEILEKYGKLVISLGVDDRELDEIITNIMLYSKHANEQLRNASKNSIDVIAHTDPMLINFKLYFQ